MKTLYWHDYETWGVNPQIDRPSQFAGVRTDEKLNIIGDPLVIYCQPCDDILPHPEACLVTGITPQLAKREGLPERDFIARIMREMAEPQTCTVGYNSLRFDDEVTRYALYRNFYDPYEREWKNGNSRWDIIDMIRFVYAVRPDGIEWPVVENKPSFKLELLSEANGITHTSAHDAFSDVEATIELAKLVKSCQPGLYDYVYSNKSKHATGELIDVQAKKPLLHISSKFPSERGCAGFVVPLAMHPTNKNAVIVYDLSVDPSPLLSLSAQAIRNRVFTSQEELPDGEHRIPLKLIHLNKCPIVATPKLLDSEGAMRLGIDKSVCEKNWQQIRGVDLTKKLHEMYLLDSFEGADDAEARLYDGFINNSDKALFPDVRNMSDEALSQRTMVFEDPRLNEIYRRYVARNASEYLPEAALAEWQEFVHLRLKDGEKLCQSVGQVLTRIGELETELGGDQSENSQSVAVLEELKRYIYELAEQYSVPV